MLDIFQVEKERDTLYSVNVKQIVKGSFFCI